MKTCNVVIIILNKNSFKYLKFSTEEYFVDFPVQLDAPSVESVLEINLKIEKTKLKAF